MRRTLALSYWSRSASPRTLFAVGEARITGKIIDAVTKAPIADATSMSTPSKGARTFKQDYKAKKDGTYAIFLLDGTIKYKFTSTRRPAISRRTTKMKLKIGEPNTKDVELGAATRGGRHPAPARRPRLDPAVIAFNEGAQLANAGKVDEAIAKIEEAVTAKPDLIAG